MHLEGDLETSGPKLEAPEALLPLITDFLTWAPLRLVMQKNLPKSALACAAYSGMKSLSK